MAKNNIFFGILLMVVGAAALASKDGIVKTILDQIGPFQILWIQFAGVFLCMAIISLPKHGLKVIFPSSITAQFVRGALNAAAVASFFWALKYIPLADATAMMLFAPIVTTIMAPFFLGEKIGRFRITAAIFGFCGVLIILRPGFSGDHTGYYFGLASGILMGLYFIANRRLSGSQHFLLNITHNSLMGTLSLTPVILLFWEPLPTSVYMEIGFIIILAAIGQSFLITSFKFAPAALISPYSYTLLIFSTLIGYFVFGTLPDKASWIGITLIVGSGVYIAHRERKFMKI
jgi:drug/metabolite transporter (DMT)-like permease